MRRVKKEVLELLQELISFQQKTVESSAMTFNPRLTEEDLLQPNDFPELELNPLFRYEEGVLAGMKTVEAALLAFCKEE